MPSSGPEVRPGPAVRLNRFLARAGVASRRHSDELIQQGAIRVNGAVVSQPGASVDPDIDVVEYQGRRVRPAADFEYVAFHKPAGCLVTRRDLRGRRTIYEYLPHLRAGTVAVGRLDRDTTGLLLLTDDGELAFRLMHPRYGVDKVYEASVAARPTEAGLDRLRHGVELEDGMTAPAAVYCREAPETGAGGPCLVTLRIHEGRKRQVRRMLRAIGHPVHQLHRRAFGGLELDLAEPGSWRQLAPREVAALAAQVALTREA